MLAFLKVRNFGLIDEVEVEFADGLNVITGETGAGKSILVNALFSFFNPRIREDVIREGAERAEIIAQFFWGGEEYILKKIISLQGRSRTFLNEEPISFNRMEEVSRAFVSICSQNEYQQLLDKNNYVFFIDHILSLEEERKELQERVEKLRNLKKEIEEKQKILEGSKKEIEILDFQLQELQKENIKEHEEEEIKEKIKVLRQGEKIRKILKDLRDLLYEAEDSQEVRLKRILSEIRAIDGIEWIEQLKKRIETFLFEIEDIYRDARDFEKHLTYDRDELPRLEQRLSRIFELKSKYGKSVEEIKAYEEKITKRLEFLRNLTTHLEQMRNHIYNLETEVVKRADDLSEKRKRGAKRLENEITQELLELAMKDSEFRIPIEDKGFVDITGKDDVEFLIKTNVGEQFKPLRRIASGGELSRIMLAIKKVMGGEEGKTIIFDEVDTGIGGRVADIVGRRLKELTKKYQIICITHLPQIAVYGNHHLVVEKRVEDQRAKTFVRNLRGKERTLEIARMIGGVMITEKTLQRAKEMLEYAQKGIN